MSHNITIEGGTSKRLPVAGKYCDQDIIITATGGTPTLQNKTVTPTETAQTVTPDTGYDGLAKVDVNAIPDQYLAEAEVIAQDALIANILAGLEGKAAGGGSSDDEESFCTLRVTVLNAPEDAMMALVIGYVSPSGNLYEEIYHELLIDISDTGENVYEVYKKSEVVIYSNNWPTCEIDGDIRNFGMAAADPNGERTADWFRVTGDASLTIDFS